MEAVTSLKIFPTDAGLVKAAHAHSTHISNELSSKLLVSTFSPQNTPLYDPLYNPFREFRL